MRDEGVEGLSSEGETTERGRWGDVLDCVGIQQETHREDGRNG